MTISYSIVTPAQQRGNDFFIGWAARQRRRSFFGGGERRAVASTGGLRR